MTAERRLAVLESIAEEARQQMLFLGQGDDAVADIARRQHPELFSQRAGTAAFVRHRHDRAELRDGPRPLSVDVAFQSAQQRREPGAAADRDDVEAVMAHPSDCMRAAARVVGCWLIALRALGWAVDNAAKPQSTDNRQRTHSVLLVRAEERLGLAERLGHAEAAADVVEGDFSSGQRRAELEVGLPLAAVAVADVERVAPEG